MRLGRVTKRATVTGYDEAGRAYVVALDTGGRYELALASELSALETA